MDDYSVNSLTESKNEWCARLVNILTHHIRDGFKSIFEEAIKICEDNEESNKYLMTFQNLLTTIPDWNTNTIEVERKRIESNSGCKYLEDLITCVHIIQLKALTCIRVGNKQKKIDIEIPSLNKFIHQIYIIAARKIYANTYLYERDLYPMQIQKNNRILEVLIQESILNAIRDNVPVESILRSYMEENETFEDVEHKPPVEEATQSIPEPEKQPIKIESKDMDVKLDEMAQKIDLESKETKQLTQIKPDLISEQIDSSIISKSPDPSTLKLNSETEKIENASDKLDKPSLSFSDTDISVDSLGKKEEINAPKDIETVNKIAEENLAKRKLEDEADDEKISIGGDVSLAVEAISLD